MSDLGRGRNLKELLRQAEAAEAAATPTAAPVPTPEPTVVAAPKKRTKKKAVRRGAETARVRPVSKADSDQEEEDSPRSDEPRSSAPVRLSTSAPGGQTTTSGSASVAVPSDGSTGAAVTKKKKKRSIAKKRSVTAEQLAADLATARIHEAQANRRCEDEKKLRLVSERLLSTMLQKQNDKALEQALQRWKVAEDEILALKQRLEEKDAEIAQLKAKRKL